MSYLLNLNETGAVLSACEPNKHLIGMTPVDTLPNGNITDYDYVDGTFVLNEERKAQREANKLKSDISVVQQHSADIAYLMMLQGEE